MPCCTKQEKTIVTSLKELLDDSELANIDDPEEKFVTNGVSWQMYEALLTKLCAKISEEIQAIDEFEQGA
ncbi:hypothetical protein [Nostoc sp. PA-18-2419]|uniref:hypothetical protein n=1 Tax=Nostoc sp. PA-18-2419 TaxID=2575443 RepID=UPI00294FFD31|nr:hypothetical protein [Nostoc sp. PA-18-2419]